MNKFASIIIVNWNGLIWLSQCLPAVAAQTYPHYEVIVVDNGSIDGSVEWVQANFSGVRLVCNKTNMGFAKANNQGIKIARGNYLVTLNNDTLPESTWLTELVNGLVSNDVGMVACKMLVWDTPELLDSAGIKVDWAGIAWNIGWHQPAYQFDTAQKVFGPCAGAALYRREMLKQIGLFDEDFFAYYEDVDLAWRAQRAGWRCWYTPTAKVLHKHSATGGKDSPLKQKLLGRNRIWTLVKNYPGTLWYFLPLILVYELIIILYFGLTGDNHSLWGRWEALTTIKPFWAKRKQSNSHQDL